MITQEELKSKLNYDSGTGIFTWIESRGTAKKGSVAGYYCYGYIRIGIDGVTCSAHRLAWLYEHGYYPVNDIDHIDGDKSNNSLCNLRQATRKQNMQNKRTARSDNKTGLLGVSLHKRTGKYQAQIMIGSKYTALGYYNTAIDAHEAYLKAKREHHEFCTI